MSGSAFGKTLTGGIQDLSALLPLIGTEQCEKHVGSALDGGFLYAAVAPLSLFGSPGIVKTGISVLVASISIPSLTFTRSLKPSIAFSGLRWCGARVLNDAGFKPMGTVAPMIAMDKRRYAAESRLLQMLSEKHIDDPENLTIRWKSTKWNIYLILCTAISAVVSITPYVHLLLGIRNLAWVFPLLRTLGSCLTAICCQFLIQSRVISIMKNRIIFMRMHQRLLSHFKEMGVEKPELHLQNQDYFRWDKDMIAEECLSSLEHYLSTEISRSNTCDFSPLPSEDLKPPSRAWSDISISILVEPPDDPFKDLDHHYLLQQIHEQRKSHFPNHFANWVFVTSSWILLLFAIPAAIAGYIGSFTLASNSTSKGPAIWLGVEVALSVIRILLWAWNPSFDETTDVTLHLALTEEEPLITTEKDVRRLKGTLPLIPEERFLQLITRYTGPLEQFKGPGNIALYFTLAGGQGIKHLFMTVLDMNKRMAFSIHRVEEEMVYVSSSISPDTDRVEMQATMLSELGENHPWKLNNPALLTDLSHYYDSLLHALNRTGLNSHQFSNPLTPIPAPKSLSSSGQLIVPPPSATLSMKWNFELIPLEKTMIQNDTPPPRPLSKHDTDYLERDYEHHLKSRLIETWSGWLVRGMEAMRDDALPMCCYIDEEQTGNGNEISELDKLNIQMAMEWRKDEMALLEMSIKLEEILYSRMEGHIEMVVKERGDDWLGDWFALEWSAGRKRRLEHERIQARERITTAAQGQTRLAESKWEKTRSRIDEAWVAVIEHSIAPEWVLELADLRVLSSFGSNQLQTPLQKIRIEIEKTIERIRTADPSELDQAYGYLECTPRLAKAVYSRCADLWWLSHDRQLFVASLSVASVYDVMGCELDVIHEVLRNSSARSVVNIEEALIAQIKENDHLFYLSDDSEHEVILPFIQKNRERWWAQQRDNSSTFYLTPTFVSKGARAARTCQIACLMIFLRAPAHLRIKLLHRRTSAAATAVSIREGECELAQIHNDEIPPYKCGIHNLEFDSAFVAGRHELQLVVMGGPYRLYDVLVEFYNATSSPSQPGQ